MPEQPPSSANNPRSPASLPLPAELWLMGQAPRLCTISKVANNNLIFLSVQHSVEQGEQGPSADDPADLLVQGEDATGPLRIRTRISNHTRERWVLEPLPGSLSQLPLLKKAMSNGSNGARAGSDQPLLRRAEVLASCRQLVTRYLTEHYAKFYSVLDDALFIAAATRSHGKNDLLAAVRLVEQSHAQLEHGFIERVRWLIDAAVEPDFEPIDADFVGKTAPPVAAEAGSGSGALLRPATLAAHAAQRNEASLDRLAQRFSSIVHRLCNENTLPFGPAWLCHHFADTIATLELSEQAEQIVFGVFRDTVLGDLDSLYGRLNSLLADQHILPGLEQSAPRSAGGSPAQRTATARYSGGIAERRAQTKTSHWENEQGGPNTTLLLQAARRLWAIAGGGSEETDAEPHGQMMPESSAIRSVVEQLLRSIQAGDQIHPEALASLRNLHTPLLHLCLSDGNFFTEQQHPARQSLNLIARLCRESHFGNGLIRRRIQAICERIAQESRTNPAVFGAVLTPLRELATRQQSACQRNIARVAAMQEGQYQFKQAHAEVDEQLYQRYAGSAFPRILLQLLDSGWHKYMIHTLLSHGEDSTQWRECLGIFHSLYCKLTTGQQGKRHSNRYPSVNPLPLAAHLEHPLDQLGIHTAQYHRVVEQLDALLQNPDSTQLAPSYPGARGNSDDPERPTPADRWLLRCRQLVAGDWFGWLDNPLDEPVLLAWVANDHSRYVFVNEQGHQLFDWSQFTLAENMQHGFQRVTAPDAWPAVDDGLYQIAQSRHKHISHIVSLEPQTGLLNRSAFESRLAELAKLAGYSDACHALIGIDIDRPSANCTDQREQVQACARVIASACPDQAVLARISSSRFGIILPYKSGSEARQFAKGLLGGLQPHLGEARASLGIVAVTGRSSSTTTLLQQLAELLRQTTGAEARSVLWQDDVDPLQHQHAMLEWITALGDILEQDRLRLRCQAIVPLNDLSGTHHEILLGVVAPDGKVMLPGELISAAEQYHRMDIIDRWVVQHSLRWLRQHTDRAAGLGRIHINLSGNSISNDLFLNFLLAELDRGDLHGARLCFEITENAATVNLPKAADFIARVQSRGCLFALDNFGGSPHSLEYLRKLPVDLVKIDGSLITRIQDDPATLARVDAIHCIARYMNKQTIAECVENEALLQILERIGIDYGQGFAIAKPTLLTDA